MPKTRIDVTDAQVEAARMIVAHDRAVGRETPDSIRKIADAGKFVLKKSSNGKYHFDLVASDGRVIATSGTYDSKLAALRGIESFKLDAHDAQVEDRPEA